MSFRFETRRQFLKRTGLVAAAAGTASLTRFAKADPLGLSSCLDRLVEVLQGVEREGDDEEDGGDREQADEAGGELRDASGRCGRGGLLRLRLRTGCAMIHGPDSRSCADRPTRWAPVGRIVGPGPFHPRIRGGVMKM